MEEKNKTKFIKEPEEKTRAYIFQKNKKTKAGTLFIILVLIFIILAIITSSFYFSSPKM